MSSYTPHLYVYFTLNSNYKNFTDDGKTDGLFGANTLDQTQQAKATFLALTERHGDIMKVILLQIF